MWASFCHLMFRDPETDAMKGGKIRWALRRVRDAFAGDGLRSEFSYAMPIDIEKQYRWVDINQK
jgi:hypothetical protein